MKRMFFCFSTILPIFCWGQDLDIIPSLQAGSSIFYHEISVSLSDTVGLGTSVLWDFSNYNYESNAHQKIIRELTSNESDAHPLANIAEENTLTGEVDFIFQSADSTVLTGAKGQNGDMLSFLNNKSRFDSIVEFNTVYSDSFSYEYFSGSNLVYVEGKSTWIVSAEGELRTPLNVYPEVFKIMRQDSLNFYVQGNLYTEVVAISAEWYSESESNLLMHITYNTNSNEVKGSFFKNESSLLFDDKEKKQNKLIFPNPVVNTLYFTNNFEYKLFDYFGNLVDEGEDKYLDLAELSNGIYLIELKINDKIFREKVIKQ